MARIKVRRWASVLAALAFIALAVLAAVPGLSSSSSAASCSARFLAYDAVSGNFGLPVDVPTGTQAQKTDAVLKRFKADTSCDPLLFANDAAFAQDGLDLNSTTVEKIAKKYMSDTDQWHKDHDAFFAKATDWTLTTDSHLYYSEGQRLGKDKTVMPTLFQSTSKVKAGWVLKFKYNGVWREIRLICRWQPVVPRLFKNVPPCTPTKANHNCSSPPPGCTNDKACPTPTPSCKVCIPPSSGGQKVPTPQSTTPVHSKPKPNPRPTTVPTSGNDTGYDSGSSGGAPGGSNSGSGGTKKGGSTPTSAPTCDHNCTTQGPGMPGQPG